MSADCNLCGGGKNRTIERSSDGVCVVRCSDCGFIFLDPAPDVVACAHYDEEYYRPWSEDQAAPRQALWRGRLRLLSGLRKSGRLLDAGCGNGDFLKAAKEAGWEVAGTEVSDWAVRHIRERLGVAVHQGDLASLELGEGVFDAITMWHVLEHAFDPLGNLKKARRLLKPDGVLIVAVPNASNYLFRAAYVLGRFRRLRYYTPGEREIHLSHFTPATLRQMLEKAGFGVVKIGVDRNALRLATKIVESAAVALWHCTGLNWGEAIETVAVTASGKARSS
jgi:2-polyprenyl-3-methyl-5-hydroxy-6-metoxy-1,4-benzoquinol methylase